MSVIGTDEDAAMSSRLLEADPDIGLDVLHQVPQMDGTIGVRERGGDEQSSIGHGAGILEGLSDGSFRVAAKLVTARDPEW